MSFTFHIRFASLFLLPALVNSIKDRHICRPQICVRFSFIIIFYFFILPYFILFYLLLFSCFDLIWKERRRKMESVFFLKVKRCLEKREGGKKKREKTEEAKETLGGKGASQ